MVFACQLDSFQRTLVSKVVSCEKAKEDDDFFEVVCEDSILFPEGGGQPYDKGNINGIAVHQVLRRGGEAVCYVKEPLEVGQEVTQEIDWDRRLDHMQQHSGQHLITAIINATYGFETTSWWLGEKVSYVELDTPKLTQEQVDRIEKLANDKIMEQVPVRVRMYELGDKELEGARTRGLPADVTGSIRVVEIVGLEGDMCCGTHVSNLSQLQFIKLLHAEKGKKNKTNLVFLCGARVVKHLSECLAREQKLTKILKNDSSQHADLVEKLQLNLKIANKRLASAHKDLAAFEASKARQLRPRPPVVFHHKKDADSTYLDSYLRTVKEDEHAGQQTLFVLAAGEDRGNGSLVVYGDPKMVAALGPEVADVLGGKGAAHGPQFQAKVTKLSQFPKAEQLVREKLDKMAS